MQGTFVKALPKATSSKSDEAGGGKAVKDAPERVFRHDLDALYIIFFKKKAKLNKAFTNLKECYKWVF
jgi:hypothetical protein